MSSGMVLLLIGIVMKLVSNIAIDVLLFIYPADVTCAKDSSSFAVLALLPKSSTFMGSNEPIFQGKDGAILLFNATDPVPLAMWSVRKV